MKKVFIYNDDCIERLKKIKKKSVQMIYADPPYNLSGKNNLTTKSGKIAVCDKGSWDQFDDIDEFNFQWVKACLEVLKDDGTIWISGTLHNHPNIGFLFKKLNLWIINDIIWFKRNAPPLLSRNRLVPSTELIWLASKSKKYLFNYELAKKFNGGKQLRNLWDLPTSRHTTKHPTEKPLSLMQRIIELGSNEGDTVLDPFMGSGTTGVAAKSLNRKFYGIEIDKEYYEISKNRISSSVQQTLFK